MVESGISVLSDFSSFSDDFDGDFCDSEDCRDVGECTGPGVDVVFERFDFALSEQDDDFDVGAHDLQTILVGSF